MVMRVEFKDDAGNYQVVNYDINTRTEAIKEFKRDHPALKFTRIWKSDSTNYHVAKLPISKSKFISDILLSNSKKIKDNKEDIVTDVFEEY